MMSKIKMDQTFKGLDGETVGTVRELTPVSQESIDKGNPKGVTDDDGNPLVVRWEDKKNPMTLRQVICQRVNQRSGQTDQWDQAKSWTAYQVQKKVFHAPKVGIELDKIEVTAILDAVAKHETPWIFGQVREMLG
jgi:hypothetical protein